MSTDFYSVGHVCENDSSEIISIAEDYESREINNDNVWGTITRTLKPNGGTAFGNLLGYGCRFEISEDSFKIGTILQPTHLKIFQKINMIIMHVLIKKLDV